MIFARAIPPVHSPVRPASLARAAAAGVFARDKVMTAARDAVASHFGRDAAVLTDSGTSALVLALRAIGEGPVAMPGYACIDLMAAARFAGTRVILYDLDPRTLSPDLDSMAEALAHGARGVVIVHLFGVPVDLAGVRALTTAHGVPLIEDAAQGIGGSIAGRPLGGHGDLGVLSFGRGKGANAGGGGALLASPEWADRAMAQASRHAGAPNLVSLASAAAQWILGRPSLYSIPLGIPALRLGEMIYKPAHEPGPISTTSAALVPEAVTSGAHAAQGRRTRARRLMEQLAPTVHVGTRNALVEGGFLRLPVMLREGTPNVPALGLLRPYPIAFQDHAASAGMVEDSSIDIAGCRTLAQRLFTLPTHAQLTADDESRLAEWVQRHVGP